LNNTIAMQSINNGWGVVRKRREILMGLIHN